MPSQRLLKINWRRARIHERTIAAFEEEARKAREERRNPAFLELGERLKKEASKGLPKRHAVAVGEQISNLAFAAQTAHEAREAYRDNPEELFHRVFGKRPSNARFNPSTFSISFTIPNRDTDSLIFLASPDAACAFYNLTWSSASIDQIKPGSMAPEHIDYLKGLREVEPALGVRRDYLLSISTAQRHDLRHAAEPHHATNHEEDHIISALLEAHRRCHDPDKGNGLLSTADRRSATRGARVEARMPGMGRAGRALSEETHAYWRDTPPNQLGDVLLRDIKDRQSDQTLENATRLIDDVKTWRNILNDAFVGRAYVLPSSHESFSFMMEKARALGITTPDEITAKSIEELARQARRIKQERERKVLDGTADSVKRILRLQTAHRLSDRLIQSLIINSKDLEEVAETIEHNAGKPEGREK